MDQKTYSVGFYQGVHGDRDITTKVSDLLLDWEANGAPVIKLGSYEYKIKELKSHQSFIQGIFAKFRHTDIPKIGNTDDDEESPIDLNDEEGLIEKNHFLLYPRNQLLVFQQNREASTTSKFGTYVTEATDVTTIFNPVLKRDAALRLLKGGVRPKEVEVSFALPKAVAGTVRGIQKFSNELLGALSGAGGRSMHVKISLGRGARHRTDYLHMDIKDAVTELTQITDTTIARVKVHDENGIEDTVDLIADRIKDNVTVQMDGRYPKTDELFNELRQVKRTKDQEIKDVIG